MKITSFVAFVLAVLSGAVVTGEHNGDENVDFVVKTIPKAGDYYLDLMPVLRDDQGLSIDRSSKDQADDENRWFGKTTPANIPSFLPEVSRQHYYKIKACSSLLVLKANEKHYNCPAYCDIFQCFNTFKLYRHDPCTCQGYVVCEYDWLTRKLKKKTTNSCSNYEPYYSTKNFCIDKKKFFQFYKSTHPYLGRICDYQYFLYLTFHEDGSGWASENGNL
jgi:hypothetical protein